MIRQPPRSTQSRSSAASDVYKRQGKSDEDNIPIKYWGEVPKFNFEPASHQELGEALDLSLIHISEPTRLLSISYAVFCLKKKKIIKKNIT